MIKGIIYCYHSPSDKSIDFTEGYGWAITFE